MDAGPFILALRSEDYFIPGNDEVPSPAILLSLALIHPDAADWG
jgi:hypothetical protein